MVGSTAVLTAAASLGMTQVLRIGGLSLLDLILLGLFVALFAWIALSAVTAFAGFCVLLSRRRNPLGLSADGPLPQTGGILISPLPGAVDLKPGSATVPFFGVRPALVDTDGRVLEGAAEGNLVLLDSWPGQMRTVYGDHQRFIDTYFRTYPGTYFTGDGCRRDEDGYYWITGRVDDVINVSGHRIGTAEVESALVAHPKVAEAAVVGFPHEIKGQGIYAYVTLKAGEQPSDELQKELVAWVRKEIGPIATPDHLQWAAGLPKTRSGKIMRRILRKIAENAPDQLGDTSTLADPSVVESLVSERKVK